MLCFVLYHDDTIRVISDASPCHSMLVLTIHFMINLLKTSSMKRQILHSALLAIVAIILFALPQYAQAKEKEAYVVESGKTLTFYYDTQKATRPGTKWGIEENTVPAWAGTGATPNRTITKAVIASSFKDFRPKTTACWFNRLQALTQITGIENLNTSEVTDMSYMFYCCEALTRLDVSKFDTKNVTDMRNMFAVCKALTRLDVTKFKTQNVTDMNWMFGRCAALTRLDVSNFNTEKVTDMEYMFYGCKTLTQLDVSKFVTKNVTDMSSMFDGCAALTTIYCNDAWTCGNSEDMFDNCKKLKGAVSYDSGKIDATMANPDTGYFTKKGPAGIGQTGHAATVKAVYSADGRRLKEPQTGVNIVKMSDGTTRKIVKK